MSKIYKLKYIKEYSLIYFNLFSKNKNKDFILGDSDNLKILQSLLSHKLSNVVPDNSIY